MKNCLIIIACLLSIALQRCASGTLAEEAYSTLTSAVTANDIDTVSGYLSGGFNPNHRFLDGWSILHIASRWDYFRVIQQCFHDGKGLKTGIFTMTGTTEAETRKALDMASLIIARGADVNLQTADGSTPLHVIMASLQSASPDIPSIPPVDGRISSRFGWRGSPFDNNSDYHRALDICARNGTPVRAAANGVIALVGVSTTLGNFIIIQHRNGYQSVYGHCHLFAVKKGASVKRGSVIGYVGMTGSASGDHCHFEVRLNGSLMNPIEFINGKTIGETQHAIAQKLVNLLLSHKARVDVRNNDGRTPLVEAAAKSGAISRLLIDHGADVNAADENGITPLHMAAAGDIDLVRYLIQKGAAVNARTKSAYSAIAGTLYAQGTTPLAVAVKNGNSAVAVLLRQNSAVE